MAAFETHLINAKLFIKILLCKNMPSESFLTFWQNSLIKKNVEESKKKRKKKERERVKALL